MSVTITQLAFAVAAACSILLTYRISELLRAIQQHREAQAVSILKHSGLLEGQNNE